jgi:hypothetical protein
MLPHFFLVLTADRGSQRTRALPKERLYDDGGSYAGARHPIRGYSTGVNESIG